MSLPSQAVNNDQPQTAVTLRERLLETLERQGISYCLGQRACPENHEAAGGNGELNLLVDQKDTPRLESILSLLGFKPTREVLAASNPTILQFLGWDPGRDAFVDLRVRYGLLLAEQTPDPKIRVPGPWRWLPFFKPALARLTRTSHRTRSRSCIRGGQGQLASGGAVIAVVGADATGKSTTLSHCRRWLDETLDVEAVHAGKPPATWLTLPVTAILTVSRLVRRFRRNGEGPADVGSEAAPGLTSGQVSLAYAIRAVALAWERRQLLVRCRRLAVEGRLILCDRYPSDTIGAMDSPRLRIDRSRRGVKGAIHNRLARIEARLYQQIPPPDVVLRLAVSLENAKHRNRTRGKANQEDEAYLEARHRQNVPWRKSGTRHVHDISADGTLADTIHKAKEAIWRSI